MRKQNYKLTLLGMFLIVIMLLSSVMIVAEETSKLDPNVKIKEGSQREYTDDQIKRWSFDKRDGSINIEGKKYFFVVDDDDEVALIPADRVSNDPNYDKSGYDHHETGRNYDEILDLMSPSQGFPSQYEMDRDRMYDSARARNEYQERQAEMLRTVLDREKKGAYIKGGVYGKFQSSDIYGDSMKYDTRREMLEDMKTRAEATGDKKLVAEISAYMASSDYSDRNRADAKKAFEGGRYDEVITILSGSTNKEDVKMRGLAHYKKGDYANAQKDLEGVIGSPEATAEVYRNLADSYMKQKNYEKAKEQYEKAALTDPAVAADPEFKKDYANVYVKIAQENAGKSRSSGDRYYRDAEANFERAAELNPDIKRDAAFQAAVRDFYTASARKHEETANDPRTRGTKKQAELEAAARNYAMMAELTGDSDAALQAAELYKLAGNSENAKVQYQRAVDYETDDVKKKENVKKRDAYKKELEAAGEPAEIESGADVGLADVEADLTDNKNQIDNLNAEIATLRSEIATSDPAVAEVKRKELNNKQRELQRLQSDRKKLEKKKLDIEELQKRENALLDVDDDTSRVSRDNALLPDHAKITPEEIATLRAAGYTDSKKLEAAYNDLLKKKLEQVEKEDGFQAVVDFYNKKMEQDAGASGAAAYEYDDDTLKNWNRQAAQYQDAYKKAAAAGDMATAQRHLDAYNKLQSQIDERKALLAQAKELGIDSKKLRTNDELRKGITDVKTFKSFSENAETAGVGAWDDTKKVFIIDGKEYRTKKEADAAIHAKISASIQQNKKDLIAGKELSDEEKGKLLAYAQYVLNSDKATAQEKKDALALLIATGQDDDAIKAQIQAAEDSKQISPEEARMLRIYLENNDDEAFRKSLLTHTNDAKTMALGLEEARTYSMSIGDILKDDAKMKKLGYTKVQEFSDAEGKQYVELKTSTGTHLVPVDATGGDVAKGKYALPTGTFKDSKGKKLTVASKTDYVNALQEGIIKPRDEGYEKISVSGKNIVALDDKGERKTVGFKVKSGLGKEDYSYFNSKKTVNPSIVDETSMEGTVYFNNKGEVFNDGKIWDAYRVVIHEEEKVPLIAKRYVDVDIGLEIYKETYGGEEDYYYLDKETGEMKPLTEAEIQQQLTEKSYERIKDEKGEQDTAKMLDSIETYQRIQSGVRTIVVGPTGIGRSFTDKVTLELEQFEWYDEVDRWLEEQFFHPEKWERYLCEVLVDEDMPEDAIIGYRDDGTEDITFRLQAEKEYFPNGEFLYQFNWMVRNVNEGEMEYTVCVNYCDSSCLIVDDAKGITVNEDSSSSDYVAMYSTKDVGVISICFITEDDPEMKAFMQPITFEDYVPDEDRNTYGYGGAGAGTGSVPSGAQNFS